MATRLEIYNRALSVVGQKALVALTDVNPGRQALDAARDMVRREMLTSHPWNFAKTYASLPVDATAATPDWRWSQTHALPDDFLVLREVDADRCEWEHMGAFLLSDFETELSISYTRDVTDEAEFPPAFAIAIAYRLALAIVEELTQSNRKREAIAALFATTAQQARVEDLRQQPPQQIRQGRWAQRARR